MKQAIIFAAVCVLASSALAKLPAPSDEAKAKAAETAAKATWSGKVDAWQLCKSQDKVVATYFKTAKAAGKETKPPVGTPACADPGVFAYVPPGGASVAVKVQEAAGAHSPPATAISPPSGKTPAAEIPAKKP